jgi:hypothetical protein
MVSSAARFFMVQLTKNGKEYNKWPKIYQIAVKYTKWPYIKQTNIFPLNGPTKFSPNWDFWFKNEPSGNPDGDAKNVVSFLPWQERAMLMSARFEKTCNRRHQSLKGLSIRKKAF